MRSFIARQTEIETLNRYWQRPSANLLIVYGRRRVGKTSLLAHWLKKENLPHALYWVAQPAAATEQLRQFSQALYRFENPDSPALSTFTYESWEQALEQVARLAEEKRFTLIIDEFTYLLMRTPELAGLFQNMWDHLLKERNLMLVLCGSHLGMMKKHILSYQAPLYGRATAQLHLKPLPYGATAQYFPNHDATDRVSIYSIFGGIPAYWERLEPELSLADNIRHQLLTPNNLMQAEPRLLLQDFVREPDNYISLFNAIANRYRTQKEIKSFTGLAQGHISSYMRVLESAEFIHRHVPITAGPKSRQSRYHITDPYLRFYYRFLASRQTQFALGIQEPALAEIERHLPDFIGRYAWEELSREWTLRAGALGKLPFMPDKVGAFWNKSVEIDVMGINSMEKTIILGECKWSGKPVGAHVLAKLMQKTDAAVPTNGRWRVLYLGIARGGWSKHAHELANKVNGKGRNWQANQAILLDLPEIDTGLVNWSL